MSNYRVVHWGKFYPPHKGGIEGVTASLAIGAASEGFKVEVICFGQSPDSIEDMEKTGVSLRRFSSLFDFASQPVSIGYVWALVNSYSKANIVHLHYPNMLAAALACFIPKKATLLVHWHADVMGKGIVGRVSSPIEQSMLKRADKIICTTKAYAGSSKALYKHLSKVSVVPLGIDRTTSRNGALPDMLQQSLGGRQFILSVGRLVPYKGFSVLIESAKYLPDDCAVVIVGTGPLEEELISLASQNGVEDRVVFLGGVSDSELISLFGAAKVYCMSSIDRAEAFGVVLIEAMSYGVPVVATNIPGSGVPWVNQHGVSGVNVPVNDPLALAGACSAILDSKELYDQLSIGALSRYEEEFTEAQMCHSFIEHYRELLN
jgi:glycosyltransferase involved in cell wall biosynthesis